MTGNQVRVVPVESKADMDAFIRLPYRLHSGQETWIPPLLIERRTALNPKHTPYLRRANLRYWLAKTGEMTVGRISAQIDPLVSEVRGPGEGHFGMISAEDDPAVFSALTKAAEDWLREQGATVMYGPFNLSINEETGLLIEGRDVPPMLMMGHDHAYVADRLSDLGYAKIRDVFAYLWRADEPIPPAVREFASRPLPEGVEVRQIRMKEYRKDVRLLVEIFNDAWSQNWGFVPFTDEDVEAIAAQLKPLINPKLVWFVEVDGKPAAFLACLPNINEAIADLDGKLVPFGWAKLLWRLKVRGLKSARVPLMGVRREFQKSMLGPLITGSMLFNLHREAAALGIQSIEVSWILEDNIPMRRLAERIGAKHYKTYRIYQKSLA